MSASEASNEQRRLDEFASDDDSRGGLLGRFRR